MSCDEQLKESQKVVPCLSRHESVPLPKGQSANGPERLVSVEAQVSPTQPCPCLSFCGVLPRSPLFFRFSVLVSRVLSGSRECAVATSAIRGLARVVVPHLLVSLRFHQTSREGTDTKCTGSRPKNRASFRYHLTVRGAQMAIAVLIYWLDIYVLGLQFLAQPAVTSASEVLTQTYRSPVRALWFPWHPVRALRFTLLFLLFREVQKTFVAPVCSDAATGAP